MQRPEDLWDALAAFRRRVVDHLQPAVASEAGLELTLVQSIALHRIASGPVSIAALQAAIGRSQATTSHLVSQLEKQGLVERGDDPADARRTLVRLSRLGRRRLARLETLRRRSFEAVMRDLPAGVRRDLEASLRAALEALDQRDRKTRRRT
jgi:DNA-binding MarR family transcriptional regulator